MKVFAQLTKVDVEKRLVWGRAAQEVPDLSGEIMDYEKSKPHFQKWSEEMQKATGGASMGNIRAMHGNVAAGKVAEMMFHDDEKAIDICAKVVDDNEWQKVLEGVYTGFSMGGRYGERTTDGELKRYEAIPSEISLVDRPCIPTATFFDVQKADGTIEKVAFKQPQEVEYEVQGTAEEADQLAKLLHDEGMSIGDAVKALAETAALRKTAKALEVGIEELKKYEYDLEACGPLTLEVVEHMIALEKVAERKDVSPEEGKKEYGDVKFADAKNKKYPIDNEAHIRVAWNYINKPKNAAKYSAEDLATIKDNIVAAWKDKIDKDGPPAAKEEGKKAEQSGDLAKDLYDVDNLGGMLQTIYFMVQRCKSEAAREGDNSDIPGRLQTVLETLAAIYKDMATEEVGELLESLNEEDNGMFMMAFDITAQLSKRGARHSKADLEVIQKTHDLMAGLGAQCAGGQEDEAEKMAKAADLQKAIDTAVAAATEPLTKALEAANAEIKKFLDQPVAPRGVLRVIAKGADIVQDPDKKEDELPPVLDKHGKVDAVATALKKIHQQGGSTLYKR